MYQDLFQFPNCQFNNDVEAPACLQYCSSHHAVMLVCVDAVILCGNNCKSDFYIAFIVDDLGRDIFCGFGSGRERFLTPFLRV